MFFLVKFTELFWQTDFQFPSWFRIYGNISVVMWDMNTLNKICLSSKFSLESGQYIDPLEGSSWIGYSRLLQAMKVMKSLKRFRLIVWQSVDWFSYSKYLLMVHVVHSFFIQASDFSLGCSYSWARYWVEIVLIFLQLYRMPNPLLLGKNIT